MPDIERRLSRAAAIGIGSRSSRAPHRQRICRGRHPIRSVAVPDHQITPRLSKQTTVPADWFNEFSVDLSGGEWQKVALGRAYMRDAQVLILDEPTAA
ncbi:MAG: ATP-binding cassette domain-containing protein, partial [Stellaceae bacterium]